MIYMITTYMNMRVRFLGSWSYKHRNKIMEDQTKNEFLNVVYQWQIYGKIWKQRFSSFLVILYQKKINIFKNKVLVSNF